MSNAYFKFKRFTIHQDKCAMKVTTDGCLFGAWCAFQIAQLPEAPKQLLDIGAGTGLLSLMIAQQNSTSVTAVEIESAAAKQASDNIAASPWQPQISVINEDILQYNTPAGFDCIVSNPPFYEHDLKAPDSAKNMAHHSTALNLDTLLSVIQKQLYREGYFFLLLPFSRWKDLSYSVEGHGLKFTEVITVRATPSRQPFRIMIKGRHGKFNDTFKKDEILIKETSGQYSLSFIALLEEYYLYL